MPSSLKRHSTKKYPPEPTPRAPLPSEPRMTQTVLVRSIAQAGDVSNKQARSVLQHLGSIAIAEVKKNGVFVLPGIGRLIRLDRKRTQGTSRAVAEGGTLTNRDVKPRAAASRIRSKRTAPEIDLVQRAADVLGPKRVAEWMQTSIASLGGRTPYSLLGSKQGRKRVDAVLGRIEHGVY